MRTLLYGILGTIVQTLFLLATASVLGLSAYCIGEAISWGLS